MMPSVFLKRGREKSLLRRHPWIFTGAIERSEPKKIHAGETVEVFSHDGKWLARAAWSPSSQIRARVWTFDENEEVDGTPFFVKKLQTARHFREDLLSREDVTGVRIVAAESDAFPGLVADLFGDFVVCQFLTAGSERWKSQIVEAIREVYPCKGIYERSDVDVRKKEGLKKTTGVLWGEEPPASITIQEGPCAYLVDPYEGHKTGFYLDQRESRACVARYAKDKEVLNCFSYTGGFGLAALKAGARKVIQIDASGAALEIAAKNAALNEVSEDRVEHLEGNVFKVLRGYREEGRKFDVIVLDPPKFAESKAQVKKACRGYKDINLLAFQLLRPGGVLFTFSCSGHIDADLFQKVVAGAALDVGRHASIIEKLHQATDHPVSLAFPEGFYLKGLVCRVAE